MQSSTVSESCIVIVGVGLIGGSIAAAVRRRLPGCRVIGIGRNPERLQAALDAGLLDEFRTTLTCDAVADNSLAIVCLPVDLIAASVVELSDANCPGLLITDAGSTKGDIVRGILSHQRAAQSFVGSHPIAGGEHSGFEAADPDLFVDRTCVVTTDQAPTGSVDRVTRFWTALGSQVRHMTADEHDRVLAVTSHLPHILAAVAALAVRPDQLSFTGTGFRDTTRVAAGSAGLWSAILGHNRISVMQAIDQAMKSLTQIRTAVAAGSLSDVESLLQQAAELRRRLPAD